MASTKLFLGVVGMMALAIIMLIFAVQDQRNLLPSGPSGGPRVSAQPSEAWSYMGGAFAQLTQVADKTMYATGSATASDNPDKVTIMMAIETQDPSAKVSQQQNAQKTADVRAALVAKGLQASSIETTGYNLNQVREYDYNLKKYIEQGFKTTHSFQFELSDIAKAGEMIDAAVSAGANSVQGVYFGLSDAKMASLRTQALKSASENARQKADAIASGLGIRISRVMSVSEGYSYTPYQSNYATLSSDAPEAAGSASTDITPGSVKVTANVNVVFEIA